MKPTISDGAGLIESPFTSRVIHNINSVMANLYKLTYHCRLEVRTNEMKNIHYYFGNAGSCYHSSDEGCGGSVLGVEQFGVCRQHLK